MVLNWNKLLSTERVSPSPKIKVDHRSEFERDYDRALFSTPVRRLQDKAQVFPLESNDSIHTRLTHSLEVSSIARTLARRCVPFILKNANLRDRYGHDIEILCQTCGLLHDIGNPPFGHAGEIAIQAWFGALLSAHAPVRKQIAGKRQNSVGKQKTNDFLRFDGNSQTIRILTRLQLIDNYAGLNLTFGTLGTLLKYTAPSHSTDITFARSKKPGYFYSENEIIAKMRKVTGLGRLRHPLTYLVEAADDIAYSIMDIEDALKKGVIQWTLLDEKPFAALEPYKKQAEEQVAMSVAVQHHAFEQERAYAAKLRTILMTELVASIVRAFEEQYPAIMDGSMRDPLEKCCDRADVFSACKRVTREHVYFARETLKLEIMGKKIVSDLMSLFWEGVVGYDKDAGTFHFPNKVWEMLSQNYRHVFEHELRYPAKSGNIDYHSAMHLVADNVCGMTDTFACRLHRELSNAT
jgi:dGTPase